MKDDLYQQFKHEILNVDGHRALEKIGQAIKFRKPDQQQRKVLLSMYQAADVILRQEAFSLNDIKMFIPDHATGDWHFAIRTDKDEVVKL